MKVYSGEMEQRTMSLEAHLHAVPLFMAVMGWFMRKMMEAVNFGELEHLRYQYKGA